MPKLPKPIERRNPFLNDGIRRTHKLLKRHLADKEKEAIVRTAILDGKKWDIDGGKTWVMNRRIKGPTMFGYDFYEVRKPGEKYRDIGIPEVVREQIAKKGFARVLDVGAGFGNALADLKRLFGKQISAEAMSLGTSEQLREKANSGRVDNIHNISIDAWLPKHEYDLIVSYMGGVMYSHHPVIAILKIAYSLSVGGVALIHTGDHEFSKEKVSALQRYLENRGFILKPLNPTQMQITRTK
jgi:SAM-dependent methyltransferase